MRQTAVIIAVACLAFGALQYLHYEVVEAAFVCWGTTAVLALAPALSRRGMRLGAYVGGTIFIAITLTSYFRGGAMIPILAWGVVLPLVAAATGHARSAILWCALLLIQLSGLSVIESAGMAPPRVEASAGGVVGAIAGTSLMMTALIIHLNRLHRRNQDHAEEARRRLYQANKLEGIARLAGGVAHDFNNLLAVIASHARVMSRVVGGNREVAQDLAAIEQATARGAELTARLLAIGREELDQEAVPFALDEVVDEVVALLRSALPDDIVLDVDQRGDALVVCADPKRIHQVVMNLALNGRDAMKNGGRLELKTAVRDVPEPRATHHGTLAPGRYAVLEVKDDGEGIPEELQQQVFEPFFSTKEREDGSGLGLAVVDGIVTHAEGMTDLVSVPGEGTTVTVYLPMSDEAPAPLRRSAVEASAPPSPLVIMLVEDDRAVRRAMTRMLRLDGHELLTAEGGADALAQAAAYDGTIDLLLTDVVMPGMSGPELAAALRRERPRVGVIFCSGYAGDDLDRGRLEPEDALFLQKPVSQERLDEALAAQAPPPPSSRDKLSA